MSQRKVCANCLQANEIQQLVCSQCGMPFQFDVRTPAVPVEMRCDPSVQDEVCLSRRVPPNVIALHVVGDSRPILVPFRDQQRIILGRNLPEGDFSALDLTHYRAQVLGVSRQHAVIHVEDGDCTLEDLNSTNGTWLNETRLQPNQPHSLSTGDMIRLGQLMLFVSFRE